MALILWYHSEKDALDDEYYENFCQTSNYDDIFNWKVSLQSTDRYIPIAEVEEYLNCQEWELETFTPKEIKSREAYKIIIEIVKWEMKYIYTDLYPLIRGWNI